MGSWGVTSKSHFAFLAGTLAFFPVSGPEMVQRRPNPLQRPTPLMLRSNPSTLQLRPSQNLGAMLLDELLKLFAEGTREIGSSLCASREHPCNKAPLGVVRMVLCAVCRTESFHARPVEDVFTILFDVIAPRECLHFAIALYLVDNRGQPKEPLCFKRWQDLITRRGIPSVNRNHGATSFFCIQKGV